MIDKERAAKLLGSGVPGEVVAATLGCDPSYISQLLSDDIFREQVVALRVSTLTAATERDNKIDDIESTLIDRIVDSLDYITKPRDLIAAFNIINKAVRRGAGVGQSNVQNNVVVNLTLPAIVQRKFVTNTTGEVIEVDGKTTITMPPAQLLRQLAAQKGTEDESRAKELLAYAQRLPSEVLAKLGRG